MEEYEQQSTVATRIIGLFQHLLVTKNVHSGINFLSRLYSVVKGGGLGL